MVKLPESSRHKISICLAQRYGCILFQNVRTFRRVHLTETSHGSFPFGLWREYLTVASFFFLVRRPPIDCVSPLGPSRGACWRRCSAAASPSRRTTTGPTPRGGLGICKPDNSGAFIPPPHPPVCSSCLCLPFGNKNVEFIENVYRLLAALTSFHAALGGGAWGTTDVQREIWAVPWCHQSGGRRRPCMIGEFPPNPSVCLCVVHRPGPDVLPAGAELPQGCAAGLQAQAPRARPSLGSRGGTLKLCVIGCTWNEGAVIPLRLCASSLVPSRRQ